MLPHSHQQERLAVVTIGRTWFAMARYQRQASTGLWGATKSPPPPAPPPPLPKRVSFLLDDAMPSNVQKVTPSLVRVYFDIPYQVHQ